MKLKKNVPPLKVLKMRKWDIVWNSLAKVYYLQGWVNEHPKLGNGFIWSSQLQTIDFIKGIAVTNNNTYKLVGGYKFKQIKK